MRSVFKHELRGYFSGMTGFVFGAFLLFFCGIFTMLYNLKNMFVNFELALNDMTLVFLIAIPILTMRVIAEERRNKTDQLLYALPITMTQVVLGKYLALLVTMLLPVLIIAFYPLLLSSYGPVSLVTAYNALLGFFLLGAALMSIGLFISSVTDSQAVAAGVCFAVMLLNYFLAKLAGFLPTEAIASYFAFAALLLLAVFLFWYMTKNKFVSLVACTVTQCGLLIWYLLDEPFFEGAFQKLIGELSLFQRFYVFISGFCDLTGIVYFLSVIFFFVYLTVQSMEKRRWST